MTQGLAHINWEPSTVALSWGHRCKCHFKPNSLPEGQSKVSRAQGALNKAREEGVGCPLLHLADSSSVSKWLVGIKDTELNVWVAGCFGGLLHLRASLCIVIVSPKLFLAELSFWELHISPLHLTTLPRGGSFCSWVNGGLRRFGYLFKYIQAGRESLNLRL